MHKNENRPGYKKTTLGKVATIYSGGTPSRANPKFWNGDIPWVKTTQIKDSVILDSDVDEWITEEGLKKSSAKMIPAGTILMAMYGQGKTRGRVAVLGLDATINQACAAISLKPEANRDFIFQQLLARYITIRKMSNSGGQDNLSAGIIKEIQIQLPPLPEQEAIAEVLECWDRGIRNLELKIAKKRLIKKGLMQQLLSGQIRLSGFSKNWKNVELCQLGKTYSGLTGKTKDDFGSGKPFISYMNIYSNSSINTQAFEFVNLADKEKQNKVTCGDIFFTTSSETPDEVGISSVLLEEVKNTYLNSFCFGFRLHNFNTLLPVFAVHYFRGDYFRKQMTIIAQGASRYNLSKSYFLQTELRLPPVEEQRAIAEVLAAADGEIDALERKLALWKDQKKFLLNNLVTGTIRLPEFISRKDAKAQ